MQPCASASSSAPHPLASRRGLVPRTTAPERLRSAASHLVLVLALLLLAPAAWAQSQSAPDAVAALAGVSGAPGLGPEDAPVVVVQFADFECPYCARSAGTLQALRTRYGDQVRIEFHHFPLPFHDSAEPAARAAIAAQRQGRFWPFHDFVFSQQGDLSDEALARYADAVGLDPVRFEADRSAEATGQTLRDDLALARSLGVNGTPTSFVNGIPISGAVPIELFAVRVDAELARAARLKPSDLGGKRVAAALTATNVADLGGGVDVGAFDEAVERSVHKVPANDGVTLGPDTAALTVVTYATYGDAAFSRLAETLDMIGAVYGPEARIVFHPVAAPFDPARRWLGAVPLAAPTSERAATHRCLVELGAAGHLGLCTASGCADDLGAVRRATTEGLQACGIKTEGWLAAIDDATLARVDAARGEALRAGAMTLPALFVNGTRLDAEPDAEQLFAATHAAWSTADRWRQRAPASAIYDLVTRSGPTAERAWIPVDARQTLGAADAPIKIVEFSDFQCPYCRRGAANIKEVLAAYPEQVSLTFVNLPLSFHEHARAAARAAWAAARQDKFWAYHDALFAAQDQLSDDLYPKLAKDLGLDVKRWQRDFDSAASTAAVEADLALAGEAGADGTPAFFVNGRLLSGAQPLEAFAAVIDDELALAALLADHVAAKDLYATLAKPTPGPAEKAPYDPSTRGYVDLRDRPKLGRSDAPVTIVELSDFQCPYCQRAQASLAELKARYTDKEVRWAFVHLPLPFHDQAGPAARAAWAAQQQDKFWPFHDALFERQNELGEETFLAIARDLGLDLQRFDEDRHSDASVDAIMRDVELAQELGVNGTPVFLINGLGVMGAQPADVFASIIDEELALVRDLQKNGELGKTRVYETLTGGGGPQGPRGPRVEAKDAPRRGKKADHQVALFVDPANPHIADSLAALATLAGQSDGRNVEIVVVPIASASAPGPVHRALAGSATPADALALASAFLEVSATGEQAIAQAAEGAGLDRAKVAKDAANEKLDKRLATWQAEATRLGVLGSPTWIVDGVLVRGPVDAATLAGWVATD